jgi:hypothetical protein
MCAGRSKWQKAFCHNRFLGELCRAGGGAEKI